MGLFTLDRWPLLFVSVAMVVAAVIDGWKLKVPNWLTFPLVLSGWGLGLCHDLGWLPGMGAGDVKMQMGFGSWVGAFFGAGQGLWIILWAFCAATIVGGVIALGMIV